MRSVIIILTSLGLLIGQAAFAGEMVRYEHTMTVAAKKKHHVQQKKAQAKSEVKKQNYQTSRGLPRHHRLDHRAELDMYSRKNRASTIKNRR